MKLNIVENMLQTLKTSKYLHAHLTETAKILPEKLMLNGERFSAEIARHWWKTRFSGIQTQTHLAAPQQAANTNDTVDFVTLNTFKEQLAVLQKQQQKLPAVLKYAENTTQNQTQLVCLHFCNPSSALEQYYKLQRERKIWWMRVSSNPSRYFLEPYELDKPHCQSIAIKCKLSFTDHMQVEQLTFVPLHKLNLRQAEKDYSLKDERTGRHILPTVIRSVMDLNIATHALLFDACDHNRKDSLMMHRKLAPFQCTIMATHKTATDAVQLETFRNLYEHLNREMSLAGLRCYTEGEFLLHSRSQLDKQLKNADILGIPYVLIVDDETLKTGLLHLRSRDTTLSEVIHISDICLYLPNICTH